MKTRMILFLLLLLPTACFASCYTLEVRGAYYKPHSKGVRDAFSGGWVDYQVQTSYWIDNNVEVWGAVNWICKRKEFKENSYSELSSAPEFNADFVRGWSSHSYDYSDYTNLSSWYEEHGSSFESDYSDYSFSSHRHKRKYSRAWMLPLSIGANYVFCLKPCLDFYLGAGVCYSFFTLEHHTDFIKKNTTNRGFGAVFKSGVRYETTDYMFIDIFVDYLYQRFRIKNFERDLGFGKDHLDMSGLKIGFGLGVNF